MKVRIGIGISGGGLEPDALERLSSALLAERFDSIWISDLMSQPGLDPFVSLAWLSGRLPRLKLGMTFLLPGWHPLRLARQLASLDRLSGGRLLLVAVPGLAVGTEATAIGVPPTQRGAVIDTQLPLVRALLAGDAVDLDSPAGLTEGLRLEPPALQQPLSIWLGGSLPSALDRCGRLGDGWLPAMTTPAEAAAGRLVIDEVATAHGRQIDPEHFGVSIGYATGPLDERLVSSLRARAKREDLDGLVPVGLPALRALLEEFVDVGFSKFVLRPLGPVTDWPGELRRLAAAVGDLQT
jgi:probable F420-dependent oxidoreductase